jgi:hypothetical protein
MNNELLEKALGEVQALEQGLAGAIEPATLQAEMDAALKPFGPDGPWKYAPEAEKVKAVRTVEAQQAQRAGESLFRLEHQARAFEVVLASIAATAKEPVGVEEAEARWTNQPGLSRERLTNLQVLDELRRARFAREVEPLSPRAVLERYEQALRDPFEQEHASLIRLVERSHANGWSGTAPSEATALEHAMGAQALKTRIAQVREERVPQPIKAALELVQRAYALGERARQRKVTAQRPAGWKAA